MEKTISPGPKLCAHASRAEENYKQFRCEERVIESTANWEKDLGIPNKITETTQILL